MISEEERQARLLKYLCTAENFPALLNFPDMELAQLPAQAHLPLLPWLLHSRLFNRLYPKAFEPHHRCWDRRTPCGWITREHGPIVASLIADFPHPASITNCVYPRQALYGPVRICFPLSHVHKPAWSKQFSFRIPRTGVLPRLQSLLPVLASRSSVYPGFFSVPMKLYPPERVNPPGHPWDFDSVMSYTSTYPDLDTLSDSDSDSEVTRYSRRRMRPLYGVDSPPFLVDLGAFDFSRVASAFTGAHPGNNAYLDPVRIVCCTSHFLKHSRPLDLERWVDLFASTCQLCELRALIGAHPSVAHFFLELDTLVVRPEQNYGDDLAPHARRFGGAPVHLPDHAVGALLRGSPIMSAHQYIQVIMAMGGQPPPLIAMAPVTALSRTIHRASSDVYRDELLQVLFLHRDSLYRSFGSAGVRPLWLLSPADLDLSFEHFPPSQDGPLDWASAPPFGLEFTLPAGRLLIPEDTCVGPVTVHPAALKSAGFATAWIVERVERLLLRNSFTVVFRTFHVRPNGAYLVRVFLAHVGQFVHPPFATPVRFVRYHFSAYPGNADRWPLFFLPPETDLGGEAGSFEHV